MLKTCYPHGVDYLRLMQWLLGFQCPLDRQWSLNRERISTFSLVASLYVFELSLETVNHCISSNCGPFPRANQKCPICTVFSFESYFSPTSLGQKALPLRRTPTICSATQWLMVPPCFMPTLQALHCSGTLVLLQCGQTHPMHQHLTQSLLTRGLLGTTFQSSSPETTVRLRGPLPRLLRLPSLLALLLSLSSWSAFDSRLCCHCLCDFKPVMSCPSGEITPHLLKQGRITAITFRFPY